LQEITRSDHKLIKKIASLKERKYRERYGEFLVEGELSVIWALKSDYTITAIVCSADYPLPDAVSGLEASVPMYTVPGHIFSKMADTKTPQGILCTCKLPQMPPLPTQGRFIYCDRVRDPGNLGSILRSADALGFDGVMLSEACVDPFNPKLVRSAMGSLFHIRIYNGLGFPELCTLQKNGFELAVSALHENCISLSSFSPAENVIIAVGNEASGVSQELLRLADTVVKIPMAGSAESLNVAAAAAILMYEANAGRLK